MFIDLIDQITFVFDDAMNRMLDNGRGLAEFVQVDTYSLQEQELYTILLSENGGKADLGIEQLKIMAHKKGDFDSIYDAAFSMMEEGNGLAYDTNQYYIAHQSVNGDWRYFRVDDDGIYSWLPKLKDTQLGDLALFSELDFDFSSPEQSSSYELKRDSKRMRELDENYAEQLISKLEDWFFIPNN